MRLHTLSLQNFRNHKRKSINFEGGSFLIVGKNGSGKSNILEAIYLVSTTKSPHATYDRDMISHDENFARVDANITNHDDYKLELLLTKSEKFANASSKKVKLNGVNKRLRDFSNVLNSVLFSPPDIELFSGSPSNRRKYIDLTLSQISIEYKRAHTDYLKAVRYRNRLLEQIAEFSTGEDQIDFWTNKILETGSIVQNKREEFFFYLGKKLAEYGKELNNNNSTHKLVYEKSVISKNRLEEYSAKERLAKKTLIGPHRDDFRILLDDYDLAAFGSRGQQRTALLALKISEMDYIAQETEKRPILLLDDIFSELDHKHKESVFKVINMQQTIITSAEPLDKSEYPLEKVKTINI